jgi:hypothetical protein
LPGSGGTKGCLQPEADYTTCRDKLNQDSILSNKNFSLKR